MVLRDDALDDGDLRTEGGETTTYTYDLLGALRSVDLPGTSEDIEYLIDGAGRRVGRRVGGVLGRTWIYLDALRPIAEMNGAGELTRVFIYGAGRAPHLIVVPASRTPAPTPSSRTTSAACAAS